jgi:MFS family permease
MTHISITTLVSRGARLADRAPREQGPPETAHRSVDRRPAALSAPGTSERAHRTLYDCPRILRRTMTTLFASQSLAQAAFIACGTVSALVGLQLGGSEAWAGVPSATLRLAGALAAPLVAALTERFGRRRGLAWGLAAGVLGAGVAVGGIGTHAFILFLAGLLPMGIASAAMMLQRFAAAEVTPPQRRGRAVSIVVIGGAVGSVLGPLLVAPSGRWAAAVGLDELAGPFVMALLILAVASASLVGWLRPDPRDVSWKMAEKHPEPTVHHGSTRSISQVLRTPGASLAVAAMIFSQWVMVSLMVITSLYMKNHGEGLTDLSLVIAAHTFGMFALSFVAGRLADGWGRGKVILAGAVMLVVACLLAPLFTATLPLAAALFLLGLGWNFCYVGGSTLLADQLSPTERAKIQGTNELLIGLVSAAASLGGGLLFAATSYGALGLAGASVALVLLGWTGWWMVGRGRSTLTQVPQSLWHPEQ